MDMKGLRSIVYTRQELLELANAKVATTHNILAEILRRERESKETES